MSNVYKDRLLVLANFLEQLPPERFNYRHWVGPDWKGKSDLSCGTTACALGWATAIPELQDAGLMLARDELGVIGTRDGGYVCLIQDDVAPGYASNTKAAKHVFGVENTEFDFLFNPFSHNRLYGKPSLSPASTAKEVANHIRYFVAHKYPS